MADFIKHLNVMSAITFQTIQFIAKLSVSIAFRIRYQDLFKIPVIKLSSYLYLFTASRQIVAFGIIVQSTRA